MSRLARMLPWLGPVAFMVALALLLAYVLARFDSAEEDRATQHAEIVALQSGLEEANARLEAEGEAPVPVPDVETDGEVTVVPIPPTQEQLEVVHAAYCEAYGCRGKDGNDAAPLTSAQAMAAVRECFATGACPAPRDGINGTNGTNGADAQPPTEEELAAVHDAYCAANNECRGLAGKDSTVPGPQGIQGEKGTAKPGDYTCPDGEVLTGFSIDAEGTVTLACRSTIPPVTPSPEEG